MQNCIYNKIIALVLSLVLLISSAYLLTGCAMAGGDSSGDLNDALPNGSAGEGGSDETEDYHDKIVVPEYKDYGRDTVNFADISYTRPNYQGIIGSFRNLIDIIKTNELSFDEQLDAVKALEGDYNNVLSMCSLANIYNAKDSSNQFWNTEYSYVTRNYPAFADIVEELFVAAANSPYAERFEEEYFGAGLIEEYKDGGTFTDKMIELWQNEEELEAKYSSLSTASVKVSYNGATDTVDKLINFYREKYGETSGEFVKAYTVIMNEYDKRVTEESTSIFISLIKTRKEIANELGHTTYMDHAYKVLGRDYSCTDAERLFSDISEYAVPVYSALINLVFSRYFKENEPSDITLDQLVNSGYEIMGDIDSDLAEIYAYMLQHRLYDIEAEAVNRDSGAFTTYITNYNAPFLFITADESVTDYSTLFHEFGHFADAYINYNSQSSIDQKEISSQGLEYLSILYMNDNLSSSELQYLKYSEFLSALETLVTQSFLSRLEYLIYRLPEENITKADINACIVRAAEEFGLNTEYVNDISVITSIPHLFLYPFYVQAYVVSIIPSLELYFMEKETEGAGLIAYKKITHRTEGGVTFVEAIRNAGLTSPFETGRIRRLIDDIYYDITGTHCYPDNETSDDISAA